MQGWKEWSQKKRKKKYRWKVYWKPVEKEQKHKMCLLTFWFKAIYNIGQRKAFCRQKTPLSSCQRNDSVDIDVLRTYRNADRKIMQPVRRNEVVQPVQPVHISTKVVPIEKTKAGFISTMSQGFKRGSKWRINSLIKPLL